MRAPLKDEATNIIWEERASLVPLIRLMPTDLWSNRDEDQLIVSLNRPICDADWERFDLYAKKIRSFKVNENIGISAKVFTALSTYRPARQLLPCIRSLEVDAGDSEACMLAYIPILLQDTIQNLAITISPFDEGPDPLSLENLFVSTARCCQNLTSLHIAFKIEDYANTGSTAKGFSTDNFLRSFPHLRQLSMSARNVTPSRILALESLPQLQSLHLGSIDDAFFPDVIPPDVGDVTKLSTLESLTISHVTPPDIQDLVDHLPVSLRSLKFDLWKKAPAPITLADSLLSLSNLTSIFLSIHRDLPETLKDEASMVPALLSLRNLIYIKLQGFQSGVFSDDWLSRLSTACTRLQSLDLSTRDPNASQMTLEGLIPVSVGCKNLTELRISLQCIPFDVSVLDVGRSASNLLHLQLDGPVSDHPSRVLRCISLLFPKLRDASYKYPPSGISPSSRFLSKVLAEAFY